MTPEEIKNLRASIGYTQQQIADACCVSVRTVKHWEAGSRSISRPAEKLLRQLIRPKNSIPD